MAKGQINHDDVLDTILDSDWLNQVLKCFKRVNNFEG